jgi:hypothetical protein
MRPTAVVHIDHDGATSYLTCGDVRLLVIDERAPGDRVYATATTISPAKLAALIGDDAVGSSGDSRHAALSGRILAEIDGQPHLRPVNEGDD